MPKVTIANPEKIDPTIDRQFRLARVWSNHQLRRVASLFEGDIVNVSAGENVDKEGNSYESYFVNASNMYITNYAPNSFRGFQGRNNEYLLDLEQEIPSELENRFDVVFNHTVLEHVFDINRAFSNLCKMSRDIVIVVVPFAQMSHDTNDYKDYWRFSPSGLRKLFSINNFQVMYEACNDDVNAAIYLFFVASRNPEKWVGKLPRLEPIEIVGSWIGTLRLIEDASINESIKQLLRAIRRKLSL